MLGKLKRLVKGFIGKDRGEDDSWNRGMSGRPAEELVREHYEKVRGAKTLETNWNCKQGEIDLIVVENGSLVFVEVKSSYTSAGVPPVQKVNFFKQRRLFVVATIYLARTGKKYSGMRFDIATVKFKSREETSDPEIKIFQNAIDASKFQR
ncbi:MAG: YraN family protein [Planctomycetes bacterium]|nr:YraN family protein [Planctomycetota bacterium]